MAQPAVNRYTLILEDPPVAAQFPSKGRIATREARSYREQIEAKQRDLRAELAARHIQVTGSVSTLLNAIFVAAPPDRVAELKTLPGVKGVIPQHRFRRNLNRAIALVQVPAAWNIVGGMQNAGSGIKIAILDSGIDQTHPAFQDPSLAMPAGFPKCTTGDCAFTNNKVIVARSYVSLLAAGSDPANPATDSRPDDYSARDRSGHGTAVAMCAAGETNTGVVTITGVAPKAYLGNYKIYGSPGVNDSTTDQIIVTALDDAINDSMDVVSFSSGGPAFNGPLDTGAACSEADGGPQSSGVPCDPSAQAFETAVQSGMIISAAAGNEGEDGNNYPTYNSIGSPGDAPSVLSVGATTNSHFFLETVSMTGPGVTSNLTNIPADAGDNFLPIGAITGSLVDVTKLGNDGYACGPLPAASLIGAIALIERGPSTNAACTFAVKLTNAQNAGAIGAVFYMSDASSIFAPGGLSNFNIAAAMISNASGLALKSFIDTNRGREVMINSAAVEQDATGTENELVGFSSMGPVTGTNALKPDLIAPGTSMYMATENYDPLGDVYSSDRYVAADGTSFSTPLVSGAAALVKQHHPAFTSEQVRSALINSATQDVTSDDSGSSVTIQQTGAGKLDAGAAVQATVTSVPATASFGAIKSGSLPKSQALQISNSGTGTVTLAISVQPASAGLAPGVDKQSLTLAAGATGMVNVTLSGSIPAAGSYSGFIVLQATGITLRVPYFYLVPDGVAANIIPLSGTSFDGTVNGGIPDGIFSFKLVDQAGVPVVGAPVTFQATGGGGKLISPDTKTDAFGIAIAEPMLGPTVGNYSYKATAGGQSLTFSGTARAVPSFPANGMVNAASFDSPVAPGSYVSIFGTALSDSAGYADTAILPLAINLCNVTFDAPSAGISAAGHLTYASPLQVNVQVPWELQGQSSAQVKINIDYTNGNVVTVALSDYAPAFFEIGGGAVAALDTNFKIINSGNPAKRGSIVQLYANGLGPVSNQPASGDPAPTSPLAETPTKAVVMIGGQQATVSFSGLAPGYAGLYQINATVPASLSPGTQQITVAIGGHTSKAATISVQ